MKQQAAGHDWKAIPYMHMRAAVVFVITQDHDYVPRKDRLLTWIAHNIRI